MIVLYLVPLRDLATLMLVNKTISKFAEERLYRDLKIDLNVSSWCEPAVRCLETLTSRRSAAEAVRSISTWPGSV
jgi:hypothetical protein